MANKDTVKKRKWKRKAMRIEWRKNEEERIELMEEN